MLEIATRCEKSRQKTIITKKKKPNKQTRGGSKILQVVYLAKQGRMTHNKIKGQLIF